MRKLYLSLLALLCLALHWHIGAYWAGGLVFPAYWKIVTWDYRTLAGSDYELRLASSLADSEVSYSLQQAMQYNTELGAYFGRQLPAPLLILMESDALNAYVGGDYSLNSAGAYRNGVVLLGFREGQETLDRTLLHELGHHYVHVLARGNYPTWFSEGVAQLLEEKYMGSVWFDEQVYNDYYKYSISELSQGFHSLPDQVLAYRMALELVRSLETMGGGQVISAILRDLGKGLPFTQVLLSHTRMDLGTLYDKTFGLEK